MASRKPSAESLARQIFESQTRRHANGRKLPFLHGRLSKNAKPPNFVSFCGLPHCCDCSSFDCFFMSLFLIHHFP